MENLPKTRKEAKEKGIRYYFIGKACKHGHISRRRTKSSGCMECLKIYYNNIKDKSAKRGREYYHRNKELCNKRSKNYRKNNPEAYKKSVQDSKQRNRKNILLYNKQRYNKIKDNPTYKLNRNLSKGIYVSLKKQKGGKKWRSFVNFTFEELKQHLESKFKPGMTWENYGSYWHVDHIKPLSWFNLENKEEFEIAWDLNNLQPLEAFKNISKGNRYEGEYKEIS